MNELALLYPRDQEMWLPVVGHEGEYEVSSLGRVRGLDRVINSKNGVKMPFKGRILKGSTAGRRDYPIVNLARVGNRYIHQLMLLAFVGPRPLGQQALHDNDVSNDNWIGNLRWGSSTDNWVDAINNGRRRVGEKHHCARISEAQARRIKYGGELGAKVARELSVSQGLVYHIRTNRVWKHI